MSEKNGDRTIRLLEQATEVMRKEMLSGRTESPLLEWAQTLSDADMSALATWLSFVWAEYQLARAMKG